LYTKGYIINPTSLINIILVEKYDPKIKIQLNIKNGQYINGKVEAKIDINTINQILEIHEAKNKHLIYTNYTKNNNETADISTITKILPKNFSYLNTRNSYANFLVHTCKDIDFLININYILNSDIIKKHIKDINKPQ